MKLRFKYKKQFQIFSLPEINPTIKQLIQGAAEKFDLNANNIEISLNANDYFNLETNGDEKSSDLKIVNGDIIHVRLNGAYEDIKSLVKQEIACKLEELLIESRVNIDSPLLMKLMIPIHLFMTETGFSILPNETSFIQIHNEPVNLVRLIYNYLLDETVFVNLTINHFDSYICVYGSYPKSKSIHFYGFKFKEFILQNQPRNVVYRADYLYKNLSQYSTSFKNLVAVPLRIDIHLEHFIPTHPFLQILPYEILHRIFEYLDLKSVLRVMLTCQRLNEAGRLCNKIWFKKLLKLSGKKTIDELECNQTSEERESDFYYQKYLSYQKEKKLKRKAGSSVSREPHEFYYV